MDVQQDNKGKPRTISGDFFCSQQEPVSAAASNNNNDTAKEKKFSRIPSRCELNCKEGSLSVYELSDSMKTPFLILPKIRKVSRQRHDKEFFCLEYGTETDRFNIFLTITNKRIADDWEYELCKQTGQIPPTSRRRLQTGDRPIRPNKNYTLSSPSVPQGFSLAEQDGGDVPPTNDDATDETNSEEHEDDTSPTCSNESQPEPEDTQAPETSTMSPGDDQEKTEDTLTLEAQRTSRRDGQQFPEESHLKEVVGSANVSLTPSPGNSPNSGPIDEDPNEAHADSTLDETNLTLKLKEHQKKEQQHQHETNDDRSSKILPIDSTDKMGISQSSDQPPSGSVYQCTHVEIECSQEKSSLTFNKKDFLDTDDIDDMFVCYGEYVYLKSCPAILQSQLFQGTRFLQVNKQELVGADKAHIKAFDYIKSSAGQTVNLLVQLFPLGVRVRLCVPSVAALGITLHGNEIMNMHEDGVMSRIADGLRCVCPAISTSDMPSPSAVEQQSITAIGDCHVPYDANTEVVKYMLNSAIKSGNGHLVLQLQPTEFCQAIAHNALQRSIEEDPDAVLNPRPHRRPSLVQSLMSNPPS